MSTTPPTPRYWPNLAGKIAPEADLAIRQLFDAMQGHDSAIIALKGQLTAAVAAQTTINEAAASSASSSTTTTSDLGVVNNQTGTSYLTTASDDGAIITLNNASPVAVTLNSSVATPFYCFVEDLGAGLATLTPSSGTINGGVSIPLATNQSCFAVFDGTNWWAATSPVPAQTIAFAAHMFLTSYNATTGAFAAAQPAFTDISGTATPAQLPLATSSTFGVVEPDNVTITVSGGVLTSTGGGGEITYLQFDGGNATSTYTMGTMRYDMGAAA
jgi:hypothetical protein